ncbi:MAG: M48 family metallopeptidase [Thermodesulfobacteriota bacterium]
MVEWNVFSIAFLSLYLVQLLAAIWLDGLNLGRLRSLGADVPKAFDGFIDAERLKRITSYTRDNTKLHVVQRIVADAFLLAIIFSGALSALAGLVPAGQFILSGTLFFVLLGLIFSAIGLPFDYYHTFVIEERYGFNRSTLGLWLADHLKSALLSIAIMILLVVPLLWAVQAFPFSWWLWGAAIVITGQLILSVLYPVLIAPLFNKFEPLQDEDLIREVEKLAHQAGMRPKGIYRMDAGRRSTHSNAYFSGIGRTKRIVLFDTLLEAHGRDEILAVLAHELGHYRGKHIIKSFLISAVGTFLAFYVTSLLMAWPAVNQAFAFDPSRPYLALFVIAITLQRAGFFLRPLAMALSRHFERQADSYAVKAIDKGRPLALALKKMASHNLSNLTPHPLYVRFHYSHPPLVERVGRIDALGRESGRA